MPAPGFSVLAQHAANVIADYGAGASLAVIGDKYGAGTMTVLRLLRRAGVPMRNLQESNAAASQRKKAFTNDDLRRLHGRYSAGETIEDLATESGVSTGPIHTGFRRLGLYVPPASERRRLPCDDGAFDAADRNPTAAYWVGMLMADGCVFGRSQIQLGLAAKDKEHVYRFRDFLQSEHAVTYYRSRRNKWYKGYRVIDSGGYRLSLTSTRLAEALARYGVVPRKTYGARVVRLEDSPDFWRGVVDGDGCLGASRLKRTGREMPYIGLIGSRPLMHQFAAYLTHRLSGPAVRVHQKGEWVWGVRLGCGRAVAAIRLLYGRGGQSLARKRARADSILRSGR